MQKLDETHMLHHEFHKPVVDNWVDPYLIVRDGDVLTGSDDASNITNSTLNSSRHTRVTDFLLHPQSNLFRDWLN